MFVSDDWVFTPIAWLDGWYYVGYGYQYLDPSFQPHNYKISRLPWVLYQFVFRQLFAPITASYLIQFSCLALAALSVFFTCRRLRFGNLASFVASAFLMTYGWYVGPGNGGADYHNTLAAPLYAATFLLTTFAASSPHRLWLLMAAGAAYGLTVHTSVFYLNFVPVLVLQFITVRRDVYPYVETVKRYIVGLVAGGFGITVLLAIVNRLAGRSFAFFRPMFEMSWRFATDNASLTPWWKPWSAWFWEANYLPLLIAGVAFAAATILIARRANKEATGRQAASVGYQYLFLVSLWVFWQAVGKTTLDYFYFAHPLIVPLALAIAALIAVTQKSRDLTWRQGLLIAGLFAGCLMGGTWIKHIFGIYVSNNQFASSLGLALIGCVAITAALRWRVAFILGLCSLSLAKDVSHTFANAFERGNCLQARSGFSAAVRAHLLLTGNHSGDQIFVWFDDRDPEKVVLQESCVGDKSSRSFAMSLTATGFQYLDPPWEGMNDIDVISAANIRRALTRNAYIALVTARGSTVDRLVQRATGLGIRTRRDGPYVVEQTPYRITIYMVKPV